MKILFSMRHSGALRNYSSTIGELARRGHHVHLVFMMQDKLGDGRLLWEVTNDHENVTFSEPGKKTPWRFWLGLARGVRAAADYVRYGTPEFKDAHALRERAAERVPAIFSGVLTSAGRTIACRACVRLTCAERDRAGDSDGSADRRTHRGAEPRRGPRHAARGYRIRSGRVHQSVPHAWYSQRAVRPQLGQPDQQGPHPHRSRSRVRLERCAEARGDHHARRAAGAGDPDRRAGVRPVVRAPAEHDARGVLPQGRPLS